MLGYGFFCSCKMRIHMEWWTGMQGLKTCIEKDTFGTHRCKSVHVQQKSVITSVPTFARPPFYILMPLSVTFRIE